MKLFNSIIKNQSILIFCVFLGLFFSTNTFAKPIIKFSETSFDFGQIHQNQVVAHIFNFTNTGDEVLHIDETRTSCGCTAAIISNNDIKPGDSGQIKITFHSGLRKDKQTKIVYVNSNDPNQSVVKLTIEALVKADPESIPPATFLNTFKDEKGTIKIAGGTAHIPVMEEIAKRIMNVNPDIQITIAAGGSGVGIKQVGDGLIDVGNSGRAPTEEEIKKYNLRIFQWAIDGVGIVVNPKNNLKELTAEQVIAIFAGRISNWKELGGEDREINIYTRDEASGTREVFWEKALAKGDFSTKANFVASNGAMKATISKDPYGIGYISVGHIDESVAPVAFNGVLPTLENVKNEKYAVSRGLYSNTKGDPAGLTKKFIDSLYTAEVQKIIEGKGFIPVKK